MSIVSDVEIAKPFIRATQDVLRIMAGMEAVPGRPYVRSGQDGVGDVSAVIGFTGHRTGSIAVSFSKKCALFAMKALLGEDVQDVVRDVCDAVGEISNMVSGQARADLAGMGMVFQGSTPMVVIGDNHSVSHHVKSPVVAIPFETPAGGLVVEFCFSSQS